MQYLKKTWLVVWKMTWGISQIFTRAFESVEIETLMRSFCPKQKRYELKIYRGFMCHDNEKWYKNWRRNELVVLKLTWRIWRISTGVLKGLKDLYYNGLLVTNVYNFWTKKVQRSYLSWYWRVMQNLKNNWLLVWKMASEVCQIFTTALESVKFEILMGSLCPN